MKNGKKVLGILLLLIINVVWVATSEGLRYLFVELNFRRPFFTAYVRSTLFTLFLFRYLLCRPQSAVKSEQVCFLILIIFW